MTEIFERLGGLNWLRPDRRVNRMGVENMSNSAELRARTWLAQQLAWEQRLEELRAAAGVEGAEAQPARRERDAA
ncbi:MAG TPA: hypothetical protein VMK16_08570 [Acidimicrobiales bacterium]|nr:hypothetical protein [Acidimicrobiales bacterium]